jgi:hypothetical protein
MEFNFKKASLKEKDDIFYIEDLSHLTLKEINEKYYTNDIYNEYVENLTITDGESDTGINIDCGRWSRSNKIFQINYDKPDYIVINEATPYSEIDFSNVRSEYVDELEKLYNVEKYYSKYHNFIKETSGVFNIRKYSFPISLFKKDYIKTIVPDCYVMFGETIYRKSIILMKKTHTAHEIKTYNYNVKIILKWS